MVQPKSWGFHRSKPEKGDNFSMPHSIQVPRSNLGFQVHMTNKKLNTWFWNSGKKSKMDRPLEKINYHKYKISVFFDH